MWRGIIGTFLNPPAFPLSLVTLISQVGLMKLPGHVVLKTFTSGSNNQLPFTEQRFWRLFLPPSMPHLSALPAEVFSPWEAFFSTGLCSGVTWWFPGIQKLLCLKGWTKCFSEERGQQPSRGMSCEWFTPPAS